MPQLIAVALIGGLVWYAWRAFKREMARIAAVIETQEKKKRKPGEAANVTVLEKGKDGVYRPKDDKRG